MANPKHVERLKQGVDGWNTWKRNFSNVEFPVNLSGADLSHANLSGADLSYASLRHANLSGADLSYASLRHGKLIDANLIEADLSGADLSYAQLNGTNLIVANLSGAYLNGAYLNGADLSGVYLTNTHFGGVDLRTTKGLTEIKYYGPSHIDLHTIQLPQDGSALHFLRGVGIPDPWIDFWRAEMMHPIQYHSLFISYSSKDEILAHRLHADLQAHGVRCWFAPEDLKIGTKFRQRIDEAIQQQDKLLLLLSEQSIASTWVENEVEAALEKEDQQQREVLFPIRLDNAVMQTPKAWAATLRRARNIGDFTVWTDPQKYQRAFDRLLRDLKQN